MPPDGPLGNTVLAGMHPVLWLHQQPEVFKKHFVAYLLFFEEIDVGTFEAAAAANYVEVADHRPKDQR